jgi:hypothetical protein
MTCPNCGSSDVREACCGDSASTCRKCGHRFEGGGTAACPLKREPEPSVEPEYQPLTDEQLWGIWP